MVLLCFLGELSWGFSLFYCQRVNPTPEYILISSGDVGLLPPYESEDPFKLKPMKILGAMKNLCLSSGQPLGDDESDVKSGIRWNLIGVFWTGLEPFTNHPRFSLMLLSFLGTLSSIKKSLNPQTSVYTNPPTQSPITSGTRFHKIVDLFGTCDRYSAIQSTHKPAN